MVAAMPLLRAEAPPSGRGRAGEVGDQLLTLHEVSWDRYLTIREALSDRRALRMTYLEGTLELMTTGLTHELTNGTLGRLVEAYADEMEIDLFSHGRATFRKQARARGIEPDECYARRPLESEEDVPDLAIEIVVTSGTLDKLSVYAGLGVPEVWFWKSGALSIHWLGVNGYELKSKSRLLPELDVDELASFLQPENQPQAVRAFRARLRERRASR